MIDFEEELKKYKPCLEVDGVEDNLNTDELDDMVDILKAMINRAEGKKKGD